MTQLWFQYSLKDGLAFCTNHTVSNSDQQQRMNGGQKKDERNGLKKAWKRGIKCEKPQQSDTKENQQNAEKYLRRSRKQRDFIYLAQRDNSPANQDSYCSFVFKKQKGKMQSTSFPGKNHKNKFSSCCPTRNEKPPALHLSPSRCYSLTCSSA